tara:strand:+ start:3375 stop:4703 length:1329 start_codon:yes stop_codon:yes gene_type:complete
MSLLKGKNHLGARGLYITRSVYNARAITVLKKVSQPTIETLQIKDFLKDEKLLIGRVDNNNNPVFPLPYYLKPFPNHPEKLALNFVVDAYADMKRKFDKYRKQGYVPQNVPGIIEMRVDAAYSSPNVGYKNHIELVKKDFMGYLERNGRLKKVSDFSTFVPIFMEYVELTNPGNPITRSMFILSKLATPFSSGLMFEVYSGDAGNDELKIELFYKQRNFEYFKNLAYSYGFVVDKHIPWRLVADMNSPLMEPYIDASLKTQNAGAPAVLNTCFKKTYSDDVPTLIKMLSDVYNSIVTRRPYERIYEAAPTASPHHSKTVQNGCKTKKTIRRDPVTVGELYQKYKPPFWINLYTRIRNLETGLLYREETVQEIVDRSIDLAKKLDTPSAMRYIITKFDNVEHHAGSLFHDTVRADMAMDPSATDASVSEKVRRSVQASNFVVY